MTTETYETIRAGTRGSALARTQTAWVLECLRQAVPTTTSETIVISTQGDRDQKRAPAEFGGKGMFTIEIEEALLGGDIDLAVHSLKDLPTEDRPGLCLGGIPPREDPDDVLVGPTIAELTATPERYQIGTSSLRRSAQLRCAFPGCEIVPLRGNVDTRLRKVREGVVGGAVLAAAGLARLGRTDAGAEAVPHDLMLPAPGQGALAVQVRADSWLLPLLRQHLHCADTAATVAAERSLLNAFGGGCLLPVGALATVESGGLTLRARVVAPDGAVSIEDSASGPIAEAEEIGSGLAARMLGDGAAEILGSI